MYKITIKDGNDEMLAEAEKGDNLYDILLTNNIQISAPCGGNGKCGKCKVKVVPSRYEELSEEEKKYLSDKDYDNNIRLACFYKISSDAEVTIKANNKAEIMTDSKINVAETAYGSGYGIAIDIGTTTVAAYLYNLADALLLGCMSEMNAQVPFGADVITRIQYTVEHEYGLEVLHKKITGQLKQITERLCSEHGMEASEIVKITIAGNTTMLHILADESPKTMAVAPFTPVFLEEKYLDGSLIDMSSDILLNLMPSISAYVGADVVAGILASKLHESDKLKLFVDIGTNGEMVLGNKDGMICCSTAAGPALEGAKISCGMAGISGAINHFSITNGKMVYSTINNEKPIGICGSGIVDVVSEMLKNEIIDESGYLEEELYIAENISFAPRDIREVQLAKAAVAAGIHTMCSVAGVNIDDIDECIIAGGFGSFMDSESACNIGLIPKELKNKITIAGNTAGSGAAISLLTGSDCGNIVDKVKYIELSAMPEFNEKFTDNMFF